jgi:8-oxo-dGTP pyrophosphatase MutT (NUDIX family)
MKDRRQVGDFRIFTVDEQLKTSPRTGQDHDFYVINTRNWVNVIALTPERQMVLVEQYRHGSDTIELEVPGGVMDAGDTSPLVTATRELREETGYAGDPPRVIGEILPNPAIMNNRCYTVLIENCRLEHATHFDPGEDIATHLMPEARVPQLVREGRIRHAIVVVALYHFHLSRMT